jgi:hypothetical protein
MRMRWFAGGLVNVLAGGGLLLGGVASAGPAAAASTAAAAAAPVCGSFTGGQQPPSPGRVASELHGVTFVSACNVWAVGDQADGATGSQTLAEHWNGTAWTVVPSQNPGASADNFTAVSGDSASDVWAVGTFSVNSTGSRTLAEHWDGSAWHVVPTPHPGGFSELDALTSVSATDVWAVGFWLDSAHTHGARSLILHWNGTSWARVASPNPSEDQNLTGVTAVSATNAWAVGGVGSRIAANNFVLHWDGKRWTQVKMPVVGVGSQLTGVSATSASDIWAVGTFANKARTTDRTMTLHWNGTAWKQVSSPNVGGIARNSLTGVAATSASNAWAAGAFENTSGQEQTLILHWNGSRWAVTPSPNLGPENELHAIAAGSASNAWAVGLVNNGSLAQTLALHCC